MLSIDFFSCFITGIITWDLGLKLATATSGKIFIPISHIIDKIFALSEK